MANKLIHLRVPDNLYKDAKKISQESGYRNVQEFTLESIRNAVQEHYKEEALIALREEFGKYKGKITNLTKGERRKIYEEYVNDKNSSDILRKYGFDKVR